MIILRRSMEYEQLLSELRGKKVAIWTCNTCARLCGEVGGKDSAEALSKKLINDGIEVTGVLSTTASCIMSKVSAKYDESIIDKCDVILSLTCDVGSYLASECFGKDSINPIDSLGPGYLDENGMLITADGSVVMMGCSPF